MRIVILGNNDRGVRCLQALLVGGHDVAGVVAHPDPPTRPWYGSVKEAALAAGVPVIQPVKVSQDIDTLRRWRPELLVLAGYTQIIRRDLIDLAPRGAVNLHGGKLPEYRGASVMNWQIINGETEAGVSILHVDEGVDTGDILAQERFPIGPDDTIADLLAETLERFPRMLLDVLRKIEEGTLEAVAQNPAEGRTWPKRRPRDGRLDLAAGTARDVHNMIRALTRPYPGAFIERDGRKVFIWKSRLATIPDAGECLLQCKDAPLVVSDLTDADGNPVSLPADTHPA